MPIRTTHALAAALAVLLALASPQRTATAQANVAYFKLNNGLEVVVVPDRRTPVVTHMLWYKVGAADEPPGKSGIAHFLEHLLFKGTLKNPAGKFSQTVAAIGGQENAFTSSDYTGYFQRTSREHLKTLMEFEADRMTGLVLTDAAVVPELKVVLEEQNQRVANNPSAKLGEQIEAALYLNHPYGKPVIGWRHEIEKLNRDDALAFYTRFYIYQSGFPDSIQQCCSGKSTAVLRIPVVDGRYCVRQSQPQMKWTVRALLKPDIEM